MAMKVAMTPLHWSQSHSMPHHPPPSTSLLTLASAVTSPTSSSSKKRSAAGGSDVIVCRYSHRSDRSQSSLSSSSSQPPSSKLLHHRSCDELQKLSRRNGGSRSSSSTSTICRSYSASLEGAFFDEEFSRHIEELAMKFHMPHDGSPNSKPNPTNSDHVNGGGDSSTRNHHHHHHHRRLHHPNASSSSRMESMEYEIHREPPEWTCRDDIELERKANSVDLPHSLRIIQKKIIHQMHWRGETATGVVESACYCSIKKAFSSMVFIIKELHSYTLQLREFLYYEDLQGILADVQREMQASFVWLFQRVFSQTPSFMISLMILLANFSVHSMSVNSVLPDMRFDQVEIVSAVMSETENDQVDVSGFDMSGVRTATFGGEDGGGKVRPVASGAEGEGWADGSGGDIGRSIVREGEESISGYDDEQLMEEAKLWHKFRMEASKMEAEVRDEALMDKETLRRLVAPVTVDFDSVESDEGYEEILKTEILYRVGLAQEPNNPLLLANYAQFQYLVTRDYDRAEEYFKKAIEIEPKDAEACNKYATFLWLAKKDLWAAEETYQQAIEAEPSSTYYASSYANFLWSTGGEDTCFPLDEDEDEDEGEQRRGPEDREEYGFAY